jgi:hypothetical protein
MKQYELEYTKANAKRAAAFNEVQGMCGNWNASDK